MSKEFSRSEGQEIKREEKDRQKLFERVTQIVRLVSGKPHLRIKAELTPEERADLIRQGTDPDKTWFRGTRHDPVTRKQIGEEFVYVPIAELENIPEEHALGIGAHEGAHARMTRFGAFMTDEVMKQVGMSAALHATEERPTDLTVRRLFPGAGDWLFDARSASLLQGDKETDRLGPNTIKRVPRHIELGRKIVYAPYEKKEQIREGRYGEQAHESYLKIQDSVERLEEAIPSSIDVPEKQIMALAKERFLIVKKEIFPEMKNLVEMDRRDAVVREFLETFLPSFLDEMRSVKEIMLRPWMKRDGSNPLTELAEDMQNELGELATTATRELIEEKKVLEDRLMEENLVNPTHEVDVLPLDIFEKEREPERAWRVEERMSNELKEAIEELFESLNSRVQRSIHDAVEKWLKEMEDTFVSSVRGGLAPFATETHKEQEIRERGGEGHAPIKKREKIEENRERRENMGVYERAYQEIQAHDEALYRELEEIFQPNKKKGVQLHSSGERLNMPALFRWKSARAAGARALDNKIFERIKTPETRDYCFTLLVDLSGSMVYHGKIQETFKAVVLLTEVLNRLEVPFEILGFQSKIIPYKSFDEPLNDSVRNMMGGMPDETTTDGASWNDDALSLREASARLEEHSAQEKFLLVFSDGSPAHSRHEPLFPDIPYDLNSELERVVKEILASSNQHLVGLGLGRGTEHVKRFYPISLPNIQVKEMVEKIGALLKDMILFPGHYHTEGEE